MTTAHQRIALLTGVSVATLGISFPAEAATVPGTSSVTVAPNVVDTLTITAIG